MLIPTTGPSGALVTRAPAVTLTVGLPAGAALLGVVLRGTALSGTALSGTALSGLLPPTPSQEAGCGEGPDDREHGQERQNGQSTPSLSPAASACRKSGGPASG